MLFRSYRLNGKSASLIRDPDALAAECGTSDVVVSAVPIRKGCTAPVAIDRFDVWRNGAHAVWMDRDAVRVRNVAAERGDRPWVAKRERRR